MSTLSNLYYNPSIDNSITSPGSITTTNCINPYYYTQPYISIRKTENGFILTKDGKEYCIKDPVDVLEYLK